MSRRLLARGRYPKASGLDQITSSNSQYPPVVPVSQPSQPGINYFNPSTQSQSEQNSWNEQPYASQTSYQQPAPFNPSVPEQTSYWSGAQMLPNTMQAPWNESWNSKPETTPNSSNFVNYQQPSSAQQQWQQVPYSTDNQGYSQPLTTNYNSQTQQGYQYQPTDYQSVNNISNNQPANNSSEYLPSNIPSYQPTSNTAAYQTTSNTVEYQPTSNEVSYQQINTNSFQSSSNNSNYQPISNTLEYSGANNNSSSVAGNEPLQKWENGAIGVTQPEELPWTYSTPQYCNPQAIEFSQNTNPSTNASWHPSINTSYDVKTDPIVQDSVALNYLPQESESSGSGELPSKQELPGQIDNQHKDASNDGGDIIVQQDEVSDTDYGPSTLSAFFHPSDQVKSDNEIQDLNKNVAGTLVQNEDLPSQERNSALLLERNSVHSSRAVSEEGSSESTHSDFVQEESVGESSVNEKSYSHSASPCTIEEPVNQEVPEPHKTSSNLSVQTNKESDESGEEPPNQQVPTQSDHSSRSTSAERDRLVIRPREESPFKPPLTNSKSTVVQKELAVINNTDTKLSDEKTVVHEVNLETFPDNLERPSDYEELRKQSPLYAHKRHLRQELNSSPSSLLCDNPDIPCVTLAPAAPPILSSAKSDKSESSTDSRYERASLQSSNLSLYNLQESLPKLSSKDQNKHSEHYEKSKSSKHYQSSDDIPVNSEKLQNQSAMSLQQKQKESDSYTPISQPPLAMKDTKLNGKGHSDERSQESLQKHSGEYSDTSSSYSHRDDPTYQSQKDDRMYLRDPKYDNRHDNRQKYPEERYYNYDERQYYSDREGSRPSSRNSMRREEYPYQPRPTDYPYHPNRNDPRPPQEYPRPSSRMSESDLSRGNKSGPYRDYYQQSYPYPQDAYPREPRDPRYRDYQRQNQKGYDYDPYQQNAYYAQYYDAYQRYAYNNFNYGFYDELYRNDPRDDLRYRQYREAQEQYRQYYAKQSYDEYERSSVHSGRSSANELAKDLSSSQYPEQDIDSNESEFSTYNLQQSYAYTDRQNDVSTAEADLTSTPSSRLTPVKFSYAHPIARFSPGGLLLTAIPSHVSTGSIMPIRIQNMQEIMEEEESFQELKNYQGPLIRGSTHKNDVIEFCSQRIKAVKEKENVVDRESYILLWELMILLLRQNGAVAGSDIAELLLRDHEILRSISVPLKHPLDVQVGEQPSPADINDSSSQSHAGDTSSPDEGIVVIHDKTILNSRTVDIDKITRKFREFLLFGHKKDALEWAMKHGLWGHALFLASKMDLRTYANVMTRFANSLALNDPLQTLYQLMSGRQPIAVTNVADKKWGDWRPHLAMILSNPSASPDVDSRSITTLGDTLASKGCLSAAHFCYIMAQVDFGTFEQKNSKLVLLTADHMLPFDEFATNEAIQCTEIYEYAQSLANPSFMLTHLQLYKFLYALRLVEHGFLEEALHYCEIISNKLQQHPHLFQYDFVSEVFKLATQLKYHDPHFLRGQGEYEDQDDPDWLKNLSSLAQNFNNYAAPVENYSISYNEQQQNEVNQNFNSDMVQYSTTVDQTALQPQNVTNSTIPSDTGSSVAQMNYYQPSNWNQQNNAMSSSYQQNSLIDNSAYYNQNDSAKNQGINQLRRENSIPSHEENETTDVPSSPVTQTPPFDYYSGGTQQVQENKQLYDSSFSFNNSSASRERRDSALSSGSRYSSGSMTTINKNAAQETQKLQTKKDKPTTQAGKTWLGGIFSRLLPRGPNQMILPDDKNPTIVWDDVKNCWVNKDSNDEDENTAPIAPPTDSELMGTKPTDYNYNSPGSNMMPPINSSTSNNSVPPTSASQPINKFQRPKTRGMRQNYVDVLSTSGVTKKNVVPEGLFTPTYENSPSPNVFMPPPAPTSNDSTSNLESSNASYSTPPIEEEQQADTQAPPMMMFNPAEFDSRRTNTNNQRPSIGRMGRRTYPT